MIVCTCRRFGFDENKCSFIIKARVTYVVRFLISSTCALVLKPKVIYVVYALL